jgi:two-component system response regulator GlrR
MAPTRALDSMDKPEFTQTLSTGTRRVQIRGWSVEVVAGPDKGKKATTLDALIRIGSDPTCDLVLEDPTVSRRHLELERGPRGLIVRDLGSRNGVYLQDRQVLSAVAQPNDTLSLGKTKLKVRQEGKPVERDLEASDRFGELVGTSERMRLVFAELKAAATQDANLLIEGETGTGKELAARAVHSHGKRKDGPLVVIDAASLTDERGLFGDAGNEPGALESAQGGTLVLDEIADLPTLVQPRLLRVLESKELLRANGTKLALDVRIIATTQRNLDEEVRAGHFRSDLFFRLAVARVKLPPLRARKEDIAPLTRALLGPNAEPLKPEVLSLFDGYDWPGNVRELRNVLERRALFEGQDDARWLALLPKGEKKADAANALGPLVDLPYHEAKDRVQADFERAYFAEVMRSCGFDLQAAGTKTGLSVQSLYRLLKKNGLRLKDLKNTGDLDK